MIKLSIKQKMIPPLKIRLSSKMKYSSSSYKTLVSNNRISQLFRTNNRNKKLNRYLTQTLVWHLKILIRWTSITYSFSNKSKSNNRMNKISSFKISNNSSNSSLISKTSQIKFINRINPIFRPFKETKLTRNNSEKN